MEGNGVCAARMRGDFGSGGSQSRHDKIFTGSFEALAMWTTMVSG